ncbi:DNA topoisomerase 2-beta [Nymphon striatum]|nr:DNA topoisomerase 2-beta [Nymphon striatum]
MANSQSIKTMFSNMAAKQNEQENGNVEMANGNSEPKKGDKRLSVERIYQKKTQLEHILLRPDSYIGAVEAVTQSMWIYDDESGGMLHKNLTFVPGLYKIFDEILVNAADNKQRDPKMDCIKIQIDPEENSISVWNNGKGIPVIMHKEENVFVPSMIFGILLTSSNYDDDQKKVTGGRNGFGAKLCNVFSTEFTVETACNEYGKKFKQVWTNNMTKTKEPKIMPHKGDDYTKVTFKPDLRKFNMESLDKDIIGLLSRRAYDIAGCIRGIKVFLNGKRLAVKNFEDYCKLYVKNRGDDDMISDLKLYYENCSPRWEVAFAVSDKGFQQISFVNGIATTKNRIFNKCDFKIWVVVGGHV